jgi:hypothetical protein
VTLERLADGSNFNRRYATGTIRGPLPGVETAGLRSAAAHAAKTKVFFQECPDIRSFPQFEWEAGYDPIFVKELLSKYLDPA